MKHPTGTAVAKMIARMIGIDSVLSRWEGEEGAIAASRTPSESPSKSWWKRIATTREAENFGASASTDKKWDKDNSVE